MVEGKERSITRLHRDINPAPNRLSARALSRLQDETRFLRFHLGLLSHHFFEITASTTTCNTSHVGCDSVHESAAAALTCARLIQSWADGQWILRVQRTLQGTEEFVSYVGFLPSGPSGYMSGSPIALSHRMRINVIITYKYTGLPNKVCPRLRDSAC